MTTDRRRVRDLPQILGELATGPYPDYIDDVLATTAQMRQRPAWTFPERWLPMVDIARQPVLVPRLPWRSISLAVVLLALLLAATALLVGTQPLRPAPPFGQAGNGLVAFSIDGDIYTADPVTGEARVIISGPTADSSPRFSLDGGQIVFERKVEGVGSELWIARADGTDVHRVTAEPVTLAPGDNGRAWEKYEFSPDGRSLLLATIRSGLPTIAIAPTDGSAVRWLDIGMTATEPSFRPPDGAEILFVSNGLYGRGVFAVDPTTQSVREIVEIKPGYDVAGASWSPDGSRVAYWTWGGTAEGLTARSHVVNADGTGDMELPMPPDAVWNAHATWSNDGERLFIARGHTPGFEDVRGVILPADGSSPGVQVATAGFVETTCCAAWMWSPDDTLLIGRATGLQTGEFHHVVIDTQARSPRLTPWRSSSDPTWQRVAP